MKYIDIFGTDFSTFEVTENLLRKPPKNWYALLLRELPQNTIKSNIYERF